MNGTRSPGQHVSRRHECSDPALTDPRLDCRLWRLKIVALETAHESATLATPPGAAKPIGSRLNSSRSTLRLRVRARPRRAITTRVSEKLSRRENGTSCDPCCPLSLCRFRRSPKHCSIGHRHSPPRSCTLEFGQCLRSSSIAPVKHIVCDTCDSTDPGDGYTASPQSSNFLECGAAIAQNSRRKVSNVCANTVGTTPEEYRSKSSAPTDLKPLDNSTGSRLRYSNAGSGSSDGSMPHHGQKDRKLLGVHGLFHFGMTSLRFCSYADVRQ